MAGLEEQLAAWFPACCPLQPPVGVHQRGQVDQQQGQGAQGAAMDAQDLGAAEQGGGAV